MSIYQMHSEQKLPISLEEAWKFLSSPSNLKLITPAYMKFNITNGVKESDTMYPGQIIAYTINIFPFVPTEWVTEITHVEKGVYFIDEQRFGPYSLWHHRHHLTACEGGVKMFDTIHYKLPLGFLGRIAHALFVKKQIQSIFDFRTKKLEDMFGKFQ